MSAKEYESQHTPIFILQCPYRSSLRCANHLEQEFHAGIRELLFLTDQGEDIGVERAARSFGMMWFGVVSVVGSWSLV